MYIGKDMERCTRGQIYTHPAHPYTRALLSAAPVADPSRRGKRQRIILKGDVPSPSNPPAGCVFNTRCWLREQLGNPERCVNESPALSDPTGTNQFVACHFSDQTGQALHSADSVRTPLA
jgi:peptide/nickel transport system ATP-binding protein